MPKPSRSMNTVTNTSSRPVLRAFGWSVSAVVSSLIMYFPGGRSRHPRDRGTCRNDVSPGVSVQSCAELTVSAAPPFSFLSYRGGNLHPQAGRLGLTPGKEVLSADVR